MRRREFIGLLGGAAVAWPRGVQAQPPPMPVVAFLRSASLVGAEQHIQAFRKGLNGTGFIENQNVVVEYRSAEDRAERLTELLADFVQRRVSVIAGDNVAALAAKTATTSIPIVFWGGGDAVREGLVASLNRPGANVTGVNFLTGAIGTKRLDLLRQLAPKGAPIGVLLQAGTPQAEAERKEVEAAAASLGQPILMAEARSDQEIAGSITRLAERGARALLVGSGPFLYSHRGLAIAAASRLSLLDSYTARQAAEDGGLMSYGTDLKDALREAGNYVGRVLKGEKPEDLPVVRSTKFELVINLRTAKTLRLEAPPGILALADEVIE